MSKQFINELKRMKDLSGYEKGRVISEQKYLLKEVFDFNKYPCINPQWKRQTAATGTNGPTDFGIEFVYGEGPGKVKNPTGTNFFDLKDIRFSDQGEWYYLAYQKGKFSCSQGQILFDGQPMQGGSTPQVNKQNNTTSNSPKTDKNTAYTIPTDLKDSEGVKKFQDWLDQNHSGWHKKYKTLNHEVNKGWGKYGPNTSAAWTQYGEEYKKTLSPNVNTVSQDVDKSVKDYPVNQFMTGTKDFPGAFNQTPPPDEEDKPITGIK